MKVNVGGIDRILRVLVGVVLIGWVLLGGGPLWAWVGVIPLVTGLLSSCLLYSLFGMSTCEIKK